MYIDLVLCEVKSVIPNSAKQTYECLFQAPGFTHLEPGQKVLVETEKSTREVTVITSTTVSADESNNAELEFICRLAHARLPLQRIIAKITTTPINYESEEE